MSTALEINPSRPTEEKEAPPFLIRFYRPEDRAAVRKICADTGFLSRPIDPLFQDRELFADYLTRYYTDIEPESTLICEMSGEVKGYLSGCRRPQRQNFFDLFNNLKLGIRGAYRYFFRPYNQASRQFVRWILTKGRNETPATPHGIPHFHINLLPEARHVAQTRELINRFLSYLSEKGEKAVYGQMVTYESRRGERMFARYGFQVIDKVEVTKYRDVFPEKVFLFTVIKDLTRNSQLYGLDLKKEMIAQS